MPTVYVIDHDPAQTGALRAGLAAHNFEVVVAEETGDWLGQARALRPACIVLAVELVAISGYSVCNKLKRDRELAALPLVLASSQASAETFAEHARLKTHADAYAHKPYDVASVVQTIRALVQPDAPAAVQAAPAAAPESASPALAPAAAPRRPARFGEEPSVVDTSDAPFFSAEPTATAAHEAPPDAVAHEEQRARAEADEQRHGSEAAAEVDVDVDAHAADRHDAEDTPHDAPRTDARAPAPALAPEGERDGAPAAVRVHGHQANEAPPLDTDAQILLERAVDTQNQTRVYDTLAPGRSEARGQTPADLIAAALGDLDAAGQAEVKATAAGLGAAVPELPHGGPTPSPATSPSGTQATLDAQLATLRAELQAERARTASLIAERDRAVAEREEQHAVLERLRQLLG